MVARVLAVADDHFWVPTLEESPQSVLELQKLHTMFSGVAIAALVAQRQLSEAPSNPPCKHTSRNSHCVKPVPTPNNWHKWCSIQVWFHTSLVSNQETLESKLWSSGKSWQKCTLQPGPRRNRSIIINLPHLDSLSESKSCQCHSSQQLCLRSSSCIPCNKANALRCSNRHTNTQGPNKGQSRSAVLDDGNSQIADLRAENSKSQSSRLPGPGPYHLLC